MSLLCAFDAGNHPADRLPVESSKLCDRPHVIVCSHDFRACLKVANHHPAICFNHGLSWLPILLIPFIFQTNQVWWLIGFFTICTAATGIVAVPWSAMMADLTPPDYAEVILVCAAALADSSL